MSQIAVSTQERYPPYVPVTGIERPDLSTIPELDRFQELAERERVVRSYHIRVRKPRFPWAAFLYTLVLVVPPILIVMWHFLGVKRGHTFLYLTDRRVVIVELEQGWFGRGQTVLNYNNDDVAGFQVFTQRGVWRLLNLIKIREKRNFYISLLTNSLAGFSLGAIHSRLGPYAPGKDAVTLCAELDGTLLAIKSNSTMKGRLS